MKKISEMTLEELQDYAIKQHEELTTIQEQVGQANAKAEELLTLNKELQKRNNALFMQVEQQYTPGAKEDEKEELQSVEDFAIKNYKGVIK